MEANELMIGDWVLINGTPMQIQAINDIDGEIMAGDELYCLIEDRAHSEDKVKPIPLTPEILEKNGFVRSSVFVEWKYERNGIYMLWKPFPWLQISTNEAEVKNECEYVHKLQHALKLCGIDKEIVYG